MPDDQPILVSSHRGFNIVALQNRWCAAPQALGPVDLSEPAFRTHPEVLWAASADELRERIDTQRLWERYDVSGSNGPSDKPVLVSSHRGFNFVELQNRWCAVPQALGPVDLSEPAFRSHPEVLWAASADELRERIDAERLWKRYDALGSDTPLDAFGPPEVIEIEPIHTCNFRCVMCHVSYEKLTKQRLDLRFLDHLDGIDGKWAKLGSLYEPTAHPQFAEIARGLTKRGMDIDLTTNGSLFTPALIERVTGCNFRNVTISFDGVRPRTYETIRVRANYAQALDRIMAFKEAVKSANPAAVFQVNYTILRGNIDEIPEAVSFWDERGFDHIGFIAMVLRDDNPTLREESIQPCMERVTARLDEAARLIIEGKRRITISSPWFRESPLKAEYPKQVGAHGEGVVVSGHPEARTPPTPSTYFQNGSFPGMRVNCRSPFKFARISYDGTVQLCYQFSVGSIYDRPLSEIWRGEEAERIRRVVQGDVGICHACEYYRFCVKANEVDYDQAVNYVSSNKIDVIEVSYPYTIASWMGIYYAAPVWIQLSAAKMSTAESRDALGILVGADLDALHERLTEARPDFATAPKGQSILAPYRGHEIVYLGATIYGFPSWLKKVDLAVARQREWPGLLRAASLDELRRMIDAAGSDLPLFRGYRVFRGENEVCAVPERLAGTAVDEPRRLRKTLRAASLDEVSQLIDLGSPLGVCRYISRRGRAVLKALLILIEIDPAALRAWLRRSAR